MPVDVQSSLNLGQLFGWHCPAFTVLQWPLCGMLQLTLLCICQPNRWGRVCLCEEEIYLPSTRGSSICGVCSVGEMLSLWLLSSYELRSYFPAELRPSPSPNSLPNPDVSAAVWLISSMTLCCWSGCLHVAKYFTFQHITVENIQQSACGSEYLSHVGHSDLKAAALEGVSPLI